MTPDSHHAAADVPAALLVSEVFPPQIGGSGEFLMNVYRRFPGSAVTVLCDGQPDIYDVPPALRVVRAPMRTAQWGLAHPSGAYGHARGLLRILRLQRRLKPCVIHCGRVIPEGLAVWAAARLTRSPYVCWAHGEEIACQAESRELGVLMKTVLHGADAIVANSQSTAKAVSALGVNADRITVVYPGVDAQRFRPDAPGAAALRNTLARPDELLLLTVGRLQRRKGHDLVLRALAGLVQTTKLRYVIVGDGDERQRLTDLSRELGLDTSVHFAGAVAAETLPAYYAAADCFVHPNRMDGRDIEGFGIVFLEAAASGLPAIAGSSGGSAEAVVDGRTGILVSGTDVEELQRALSRLIGDAELRKTWGTAGRDRVVREFTWERAAETVLGIHRRLGSR